jgi:hypothetical protein
MTLRMNFSKQRVRVVLGPLAELTASYHRAYSTSYSCRLIGEFLIPTREST